VSRSIGDVYLKKAEFNREPLFAKFYGLWENLSNQEAVDIVQNNPLVVFLDSDLVSQAISGFKGPQVSVIGGGVTRYPTFKYSCTVMRCSRKQEGRC
ncbi:putative protein phosphatase 2C 64, partial [Bienertia sinuspersici]